METSTIEVDMNEEVVNNILYFLMTRVDNRELIETILPSVMAENIGDPIRGIGELVITDIMTTALKRMLEQHSQEQQTSAED